MPYQCAQKLKISGQRGVVIIVALFIVALVSMLATVMMARLERDTRRTLLITRDVQANFYAQGSIAWAMDQLRKDWEEQIPNHLVDKMPFKAEEARVNGYRIASTIYDMQARFNINNLTNPDAQKDLHKLIKIVAPKITAETAHQIGQAVFDWIMPGSPENELTQYYSHLPVPYRAPHRLMAHISELRLVKGMTADLYHRLSPYLVALPQTTPVNVQTADEVVLMTLSESMTLDAAKAVIKFRKEVPFVASQVFFSLESIHNRGIPQERVTTASIYFLLKTEVSIENQKVVLYTLLERLVNQNKTKVNIIWQSKGVF